MTRDLPKTGGSFVRLPEPDGRLLSQEDYEAEKKAQADASAKSRKSNKETD
jgi:hypothetical protein